MSVCSCSRSEPGAAASGAYHRRGCSCCARMFCTIWRMSAAPRGDLRLSRSQSPTLDCQPSSMTAQRSPSSRTLGKVFAISSRCIRARSPRRTRSTHRRRRGGRGGQAALCHQLAVGREGCEVSPGVRRHEGLSVARPRPGGSRSRRGGSGRRPHRAACWVTEAYTSSGTRTRCPIGNAASRASTHRQWASRRRSRMPFIPMKFSCAKPGLDRLGPSRAGPDACCRSTTRTAGSGRARNPGGGAQLQVGIASSR